MVHCFLFKEVIFAAEKNIGIRLDTVQMPLYKLATWGVCGVVLLSIDGEDRHEKFYGCAVHCNALV